MGICKCRKRTDLFCFNHKVAVCEDCVLAEHETCHVKTYVEWLTDSTFSEPSCGICRQEVEPGRCLRLTCLDIFHPECLDRHCSELPPHTAKAGFMCPTCHKQIFPPDGARSAGEIGGYSARGDPMTSQGTSKLIEKLNDHLRAASWSSPIMAGRQAPPPELYQLDQPPNMDQRGPEFAQGTLPVLAADGQDSRASGEVAVNIGEDADDDKYRRRPGVNQALAALGLIKPSAASPGRGRGGFRLNTTRVFVLFALLAFLLIVVFLSSSLSMEPAAATKDD